MNKKFHKPIMIVLTIAVIYIGFNFESIFLFPRYHKPIIDNAIDPTSVIFKNERFHGKILCGEFNSKNTMGAYTGFNRFISNPYKAYLFDVDLRSDSSTLNKYLLGLIGLTPTLEEINFEIAIMHELNKNKELIDGMKEVIELGNNSDEQKKFDTMWFGVCKNE